MDEIDLTGFSGRHLLVLLPLAVSGLRNMNPDRISPSKAACCKLNLHTTTSGVVGDTAQPILFVLFRALSLPFPCPSERWSKCRILNVSAQFPFREMPRLNQQLRLGYSRNGICTGSEPYTHNLHEYRGSYLVSIQMLAHRSGFACFTMQKDRL